MGHLRRAAAVLLLGLPLLLGFAAGAQAQTTPNVYWNSQPTLSVSETTEFIIKLGSTKALTSDLVVHYTVGGTATLGTDYTIPGCTTSSCTFTIPSGTGAFDSVVFPITIVSDQVSETSETIILTLTVTSSYGLGNPSALTITVYDNAGDSTFSIQGTPRVGETLMIVRDTDDPEGNGMLTSHEWYWDDSGDWEKISNANNLTYTLQPTDVGRRIRGQVKYTDGNGYSGDTIITDPVGPILPPDDTPPQVTSIRVYSTPSENNPRLTWRVTFSEPVTNVDTTDFTITGTTASLTNVDPVDNAGTTWDVIASGGDLLDLEDNARVTLSFASGQNITDTSSNNNPLPAPTLTSTYIVGSKRVARITSDWLVRFGRTVAEQGLDSIAQRLRAPRTAGTRASAGGLDLFGTAGNVRQEHPKPFQDRQDPHAPVSSRSLNDVLPGSHFLRVGETDAHGGSLALWGRAAHTSFDGKEKGLTLDGESTAVMLGADYARQDWLGGLILNHSEGEGGYRDPGSTPGDIDASLTTLIPWAALQIREDLQFWGALGVGKGDLELEPDGSDRVDTDIDWSMAAAGIRSDLISPGGNQGLSLTLVGDALWTRTGADRIEGLSVESGEVTRFRLGLEGDYGRVLETGAEVTPRLEVGVRQDGGDAETGAGFEFGGGLSWRDPDVGLQLELAGRTLMAHDSDDLEEEGFSISLDYDPRPDSTRGLSLSVHQEVGPGPREDWIRCFPRSP